MVKACNFSKREKSRQLLIMLLGTICVISLFVITPVARGDETTAQTNEYVSVFESYDNWEWEETSDWLEANQNVNELGGWQYYSREDSEKTQ